MSDAIDKVHTTHVREKHLYGYVTCIDDCGIHNVRESKDMKHLKTKVYVSYRCLHVLLDFMILFIFIFYHVNFCL